MCRYPYGRGERCFSTALDMTKKKNLPHPRGYSSFPEGGSVKKTAEEISPAVCIIE